MVALATFVFKLFLRLYKVPVCPQSFLHRLRVPVEYYYSDIMTDILTVAVVTVFVLLGMLCMNEYMFVKQMTRLSAMSWRQLYSKTSILL